MISRRKFLGQASCVGLGHLTFMNTLLQLRALNSAAISNSDVDCGSGYKAIVCILLAGGNDSFNMLIPYDDTSHQGYVDARSGEYTAGGSGLAIPKSMLGATKLNFSQGAKEWALHPSMGKVKQLFDNNKISFLTNVGTLVQPTSKSDYENKLNLPLGLFSHSDQIEEWQTGIPDERAVKGWGGRLADLINDCNTSQNISMNISLSGSNVWQQGNETVEYAISTNGAVGIKEYDQTTNNYLAKVRTAAIDGMLSHQYQNVFGKTYNEIIKGARDGFLEFDAAIQNSIQFGETEFPDTKLGNALKMVARTIDVRSTLGFKRQTFFITVGGWDHHDDVINKQVGMLAMVSDALDAFQKALGPTKVNVENDVLTMMISEFGRTLTSNGNGSDHAWGGNTLVMGGPNLVNGGSIYGTYPNLSPANPDPYAIKRGRFIPTTSTDEYFAEVARWFGVDNTDLPILLPNVGRFYDLNSNSAPIGFLK